MTSFTPPGFVDRNIFWIALIVLGVADAAAAGLSVSLWVVVPLAFSVAAVGALLFSHARWVARNVTALVEEQHDTGQLMRVLRDAVIIYRPGFLVTHFNPAAERLFRVKAEAVVGKKIGPQDAQDPMLTRLVQVLFPSLAPIMVPQTEAGADPEIVSLAFQDPVLDLEVATSAVRGEGGQVEAFIKIIRDRTRELATLRSKDEFITVASHQLRTPLTEINWGLENVAADRGLSPENREIAANTLAAAKGAVKMAEDLLNIEKMEEGQFGYSFEPVDVEKLVGDILERVLPFVKQAGLTLYFERSPSSLPPVMADVKKLSLAVTNLVENAMRYNVKGGEITVKTEKLSGEPFVQVSVKDTGIGIPPEDQKKLFSKFFRAENAVKFQTRGSGLGLYLVRNIIRAHGGNVQVHSEVGRGTAVSFTLPTDPSLVPSKEVPIGP